MFQFVIVVTLCVFGVQGQLPSGGQCPKIDSVQQDFHLNKVNKDSQNVIFQ